MEIKATLNKPYTDKQRLDFIVLNNHNKGYEIKETESALEAWGSQYTGDAGNIYGYGGAGGNETGSNRGGRGGSGGGAGKIVWLKINR